MWNAVQDHVKHADAENPKVYGLVLLDRKVAQVRKT